MACTPKAQVEADAALVSAAASPVKRDKFEQVFGQLSPAATSPSASMPSPTLPSPPLTVESFSATVHQLMRAMEDQRVKLEEQAKTIAKTRPRARAPQRQMQHASLTLGSHTLNGATIMKATGGAADRILGGVGTTKAGWPMTAGAILQDSWSQLPR